MKRFATALIALLALVALVTAAGSLGGVDQPTLYSGTTPTEPGPTRSPPPPGAMGGNGTAASESAAIDGETAAPPDTGDSGGVSSLLIAGLAGGLLVAAVLAVILTDDDTRAPPRDEDRSDDGGDSGPPTPAVDPAYQAPADNAVVRAWRRLTERVDGVDDATTPGEAAAAAVDRGLPADAVEGITGQFESVRYGRESPGSERERRAERLADHLDAGADRNGDSSGGDGA